MLRWLEITPDYRCNNRCLGCYSVSDSGPAMDGGEIVRALRSARAAGADSLWIGGGEPTLRKDLFAAVRAARSFGFSRVKLQTNGMLLAYPAFVAELVRAGVTEVNFAIKGASAETHDEFTRTPGGYELLLQAVEAARAHALRIEADVLVYRSTVREMPAIVREFLPRGIQHFNFWLLSANAGAEPEAQREVPPLREVVPFLLEAIALATPERVTSLHTPPCVLPREQHACLFDAAGLGMLIVNPGGHSFRLEESPIEGGVFLERCAGCALRGRCNGLRAEYLARFGDEEFRPLGASG
ncbi:MAG TPA: radical SAM protein [Polyangiaceae bacterium]